MSGKFDGEKVCESLYPVMRLYLFVWPKSLLIVNYIIKSFYSMVKINLEYFHCITYCMTIIQELDGIT